MRYFVTIRDRTIEVDLTGGTPTVDGVAVAAEMMTIPGTGVRHLMVDGRSVPFLAAPGSRAGRWELSFGGQRIAVEAIDERTRAIREMSGAGAEEAERTIVAPMPGMVVRIEVEVGQAVKAGQGVAVVEAMKMENELKAPANGVVASIQASPGKTVEKGAVLIVLE